MPLWRLRLLTAIEVVQALDFFLITVRITVAKKVIAMTMTPANIAAIARKPPPLPRE